MATASTNGRSPLIMRDDLVSAGKAIHDSVQSKVEIRLKELEQDMYMAMGKEIDRIVTKRLGEMQTEVKENIKMMIQGYQAGQDQVMALLTKGINITVPENAIAIKSEPNPVYVTIPENAIKAADVHVSVPEGAIKMGEVNFTAPAITNQFSVPENAIKSDVHFTVPENAIEHKTIVNIEDKAFDIKLHQKPKERKVVEKSIIYSETTGRPEKIREVIEE